mmetsp:Transcript_53225/g.140808  ORF Transcript_53225/g.140808 Transcript_53225/m.140808 type:complete len:80 (+) Transcript_53225:1555-1794(+)
MGPDSISGPGLLTASIFAVFKLEACNREARLQQEWVTGPWFPTVFDGAHACFSDGEHSRRECRPPRKAVPASVMWPSIA